MSLVDLAVEVIGWSSAVLFLGSYILLSMDKLKGDSPTYQWMNVFGAIGFVINSGWNGALPSATVNLIWMAIGIFALWRIKKRLRSLPPPPHDPALNL